MKPNKVEVCVTVWNNVSVRVPQVVLVGFPVKFQVAEGDKVPTYQCVQFEFCLNGYVEF